MDSRTQRRISSIVGLLLFGLLAAGSTDTGPSQTTTTTPSAPPPRSAPSEREIALRLVTVDFKWRKEGFDNVMVADFTIQNQNDFTVKDLEIRCEHSAASGTPIDSNTKTIYDIVPANGRKRIRNFNMGFIHSQATRSRCDITDLVIVR